MKLTSVPLSNDGRLVYLLDLGASDADIDEILALWCDAWAREMRESAADGAER